MSSTRDIPDAIPGYYYDPDLNRYFKIPRDSYSKTQAQDTFLKQSPSISSVFARFDYRKQHTVTSLRNKTTQLESLGASQNLHKEHLIGQVVSGGVVSSLEINNCAIKDIKFDDLGSILAVYSGNYYTYGHKIGIHQSIFFFKFTDDGKSITGNFIDSTRGRFTELFQVAADIHRKTIFVDLQCQDSVFNIEDRYSNIPPSRVTAYTIGNNNVKYISLVNGGVLRTSTIFNDEIDEVQVAPKGVLINEIVTLNEDVICCGCDNGRVYLYDFRCSTICRVLEIPSVKRRKSRIVRVHPLLDNELVTSAMNSQLHLWDIGTGQVIHQFPHHSNSYSFTSSLVDTQECFLAAVSDENAIHFWSLSSGQLMYKLRPSELEIYGPRPVISHTHHLSGAVGPPCLLIGQGNKLLLYSLKDYCKFELTNVHCILATN